MRIGVPSKTRSCFGRFDLMRRPAPAAAMIAPTFIVKKKPEVRSQKPEYQYSGVWLLASGFLTPSAIPRSVRVQAPDEVVPDRCPAGLREARGAEYRSVVPRICRRSFCLR